jgi:hypothetical protein
VWSYPFNKNLSRVSRKELKANFDRTGIRTTPRGKVVNVCKVRKLLEALETYVFSISHVPRISNFIVKSKVYMSFRVLSTKLGQLILFVPSFDDAMSTQAENITHNLPGYEEKQLQTFMNILHNYMSM